PPHHPGARADGGHVAVVEPDERHQLAHEARHVGGGTEGLRERRGHEGQCMRGPRLPLKYGAPCRPTARSRRLPCASTTPTCASPSGASRPARARARTVTSTPTSWSP